MSDFALIALDGAYHSSVGALIDSYALARQRVENVFDGVDPMSMETQLKILSLDGAPAALSDGRRLAVDGSFDGSDAYSFVWLPAFRAGGRPQLEARLDHLRALLPWLKGQADCGAIIAASGASALVLMAAGLTEGIAVPVARALRPLARSLFPRHRFDDRPGFVDHGQLLIASGIASDLALIVRVLERALSPDVSRWLTSIIGLDREEEALLARDQMVANAQIWLEQRFTGKVSLSDLAGALSTSQPTLIRRFRAAIGMPPKAYVQQLRLQSAIKMLERTNRSIDRIAELVGFSDSRLFRTMFRQQTGMTATQWREEAQKRRADAF